ncbi:MAG: hypothetical protein ABII12_00940 [Planctomycetota bacterium]
MSRSPKTLIVALYPGEFGWELMNWQGRVRWTIAHGGYDRVVICARADRRALYACGDHNSRVVFCPVSDADLPGHRNEDHRVNAEGRAVDATVLRTLLKQQVGTACEPLGVSPAEATLLLPPCDGTLWPTARTHQVFTDLRVRQEVKTDILVVPRIRILAAERNMTAAWWEDLAGRLRDDGLSVETYEPRLDEAIRQLSRARLAIGASTGGLHLASLCRCPHYVWGCGGEARWTRMGITNRQRYETIWNPLGTPCRYDECGWRPSIEHIVDESRRALDQLGLEGGTSQPGLSLKPKWRVKRRLARLLEHDGRWTVWPWRVRELVREHFV